MDIEIQSKTNNPLLNRTEVHFIIHHEGEATPKRELIRGELAEKLKVKKENVMVNVMESGFGITETVGYAKVYKSLKDGKAGEKKHVLIRNNVIAAEKKPAKKEEEKPAEAPKEKPEGKEEETEPPKEGEEPTEQSQEKSEQKEKEAERPKEEEEPKDKPQEKPEEKEEPPEQSTEEEAAEQKTEEKEESSEKSQPNEAPAEEKKE